MTLRYAAAGQCRLKKLVQPWTISLEGTSVTVHLRTMLIITVGTNIRQSSAGNDDTPAARDRDMAPGDAGLAGRQGAGQLGQCEHRKLGGPQVSPSYK